MHTAYISGADLQFPARCLGCDDAADTTCDLHAWRGWDLIFLALCESIDIPVPVCRRCRKRRRVAGIATYTVSVLSILVGGYFTMALVVNEWNVAAALLGLNIIAVALVLRWYGDALIQLASLGVTVDWLRGAANRLRLTFTRDGYFAAWLAVNPSAAFSAERVPRVKHVESDMTEDPEDPLLRSRVLPAGTLAVMLVLLGVHHWYAMANQSVYPVVVLLFATFAGYAAGGTAYPPLFYAAGAHGRHLPLYMKMLAGLCAAGGFAVGMYLLFVTYAF
jgi:hypothetical protein